MIFVVLSIQLALLAIQAACLFELFGLNRKSLGGFAVWGVIPQIIIASPFIFS